MRYLLVMFILVVFSASAEARPRLLGRGSCAGSSEVGTADLSSANLRNADLKGTRALVRNVFKGVGQRVRGLFRGGC